MTRHIIRLTGPDRHRFLQGLVSNDVTRAPCWAAILTPQGKYVADFLIIPHEDALWLDVDHRLAADVMARLTQYKLRAQVNIDRLDLDVTRGLGDAPDGAIPDPRHPALGWRCYHDTPMPQDNDPIDWDAIRVAHVIPETLIELIPNQTYPLEAGFERLHGIDFRKGCYVGQEVTARMKHKTELRKGLIKLGITGTAPIGTPIMAQDQQIGTLFTQSGGQALAHLRFDRVETMMQADQAVVFPLS